MTNHRRRVLVLGVVSVLLGTVTPAQTPLITVAGDETGANFGLSVGGGGDVNLDGFDDFVVGAPTSYGTGTGAGAARVFSGLTGVELYEFEGTSAFDFFGTSVAFAGDVNKDGVVDIVIGARGDDEVALNAGAAFVYSGLDGARLHAFYGDAIGDAFGWAVAGAGDVDKDNHADLVVGMPRNDTFAFDGGAVRIFSGKTGTALYTYYGLNDGDQFGRSVGPAGDVNGDGYDDVLATSSTGQVGSATIISGKNGQELWTVFGQSPGAGFGHTAVSVGDTNGDGVSDILVGAPYSSVVVQGAGRARLFSGTDGTTLRLFSGDTQGDLVGFSIAPAGDVDGDGLADFAIGGPGRDVVGIGGGGGGDGGGDGGGGGGDDGSGPIDDGSGPIDDGGGDGDSGGGDAPASAAMATLLIDAGEVRVFSGATGAELYSLEGEDEGDLFGWSLTFAGDTNADHIPDFLTGSVLSDRGTFDGGLARMFSGNALPLYGDNHLISIATGGEQKLFLDAGPAYANQLYYFAGSASGTSPGVPTSLGAIPLNPDGYTNFLFKKPGGGPLDTPIGFLDAKGRATCAIEVPTGLSTNLVGVTLYHAYGVLDVSLLELVSISNATPLTLLD